MDNPETPDRQHWTQDTELRQPCWEMWHHQMKYGIW